MAQFKADAKEDVSAKIKVLPGLADLDIDMDSLDLALRALNGVIRKNVGEFVGDNVTYSFTPASRQQRKIRGKVQLPYIDLGISRMALDPMMLAATRAAMKKGVTRRRSVRANVDAERPGQPNQPGTIENIIPIQMELGINITYVDTDVRQVFAFSQKLLLMIGVNGLSFKMTYAGCSWEVQVRSDSAALEAPGFDQWIDMESEETTETQAFMFPVVMKTKVLAKTLVPALTSFKVDMKSPGGHLLEALTLEASRPDEINDDGS